MKQKQEATPEAEAKAKAAAAISKAVESRANFDYYRVDFKLRTEMLSTCNEHSMMDVHVMEKTKKAIKEANKLNGRMNKILDKYIGTEIPDAKQVHELQGLIRTFAELVGKPARIDLPNVYDELLPIVAEIEADYHELLKKGEEVRATVFMKQPRNGDPRDIWPVISTHIILGNLKELIRIITNNGDKSILSTKVSIGETMAADVKAVEEFMFPNMDITRDEEGNRVLLERPILFNDKGVTKTTIGVSETLPAGAEFGCTLRVRKNSPITEAALRKLFDLAKNDGFGAWRGSGGKGSYFYKLEKLPKFKEPVPEGWN